MKKMNLDEFVSRVLEGKKYSKPVEVFDNEVDKANMRKLCNLNIGMDKLENAWNWLLHDISEKYYPKDMTMIFDKDILLFLINNHIALNSLGHLQLENRWLEMICGKSFDCDEAFQTIEYRKKLLTKNDDDVNGIMNHKDSSY